MSGERGLPPFPQLSPAKEGNTGKRAIIVGSVVGAFLLGTCLGLATNDGEDSDAVGLRPRIVITETVTVAPGESVAPVATSEPAAVNTETDEPEPEPSTPRETPRRMTRPVVADTSAEVSCRHWRNVHEDVLAGVYTDAELRERIQEVDSTAFISETPGIAEHSRLMLTSITQGDSDGLVQAANAFTAACTAAGV